MVYRHRLIPDCNPPAMSHVSARMGLQFGGIVEKDQVEKALESLPKTASDSLRGWRTKAKEQKQVEARAFLAIKETKLASGKPPSDEVAWMKVYLDEKWDKIVDENSDAEAAFYLNDETLKSVKKLSDIRSAY